MRAAIAAAEVGDEQRDDDPTVARLLDRVATLLGKPAALFLPTGTMCNLIALKLHTNPGDVVIAHTLAHVFRAEAGGAGLVAGVLTEPVATPENAGLADGLFGPETLARALERIRCLPRPYSPPARLLCVEQTHNLGGGSVWPPDLLEQLCDYAHAQDLQIHMDGARLLNAACASAVEPARFAAPVDTVWIDFTKGLGAPMGAVMAGSVAAMRDARRLKHAFGGAMRQAGIAAAACLYALDHHVGRLADDHRNAQRLAEGIAGVPGIGLPLGPPQTNIVFFDVLGTGLSSIDFAARCAARGLQLVPMGTRLRAVTHLDVSTMQIDDAIRIIAELADDARPS